MIRRLLQLYAGLAAYGFSLAMMVRGDLGLDPWDVLHQGLSERTGISIGSWVIIVGALVLLLWLPLRQRPGIGTVSNVFAIGLALDASLWLLPKTDLLAPRSAYLVGGVVLNGVATACYIGARLGPGPRDGLMTGLAGRGHSIRVARTIVEVSVLALGWLLGGSVGVGTVLYAGAIGPIVHRLLPVFTRNEQAPAAGTHLPSAEACPAT
jgi:uncharacterized membrane protein YczE